MISRTFSNQVEKLSRIHNTKYSKLRAKTTKLSSSHLSLLSLRWSKSVSSTVLGKHLTNEWKRIRIFIPQQSQLDVNKLATLYSVFSWIRVSKEKCEKGKIVFIFSSFSFISLCLAYFSLLDIRRSLLDFPTVPLYLKHIFHFFLYLVFFFAAFWHFSHQLVDASHNLSHLIFCDMPIAVNIVKTECLLCTNNVKI